MAESSSRGRHFGYVFIYVLLLLSTVFVVPYVVQQVQYSLVRGRLEAEADVAGQTLRDLPDAEHRFRLVAHRVAPSVVHIETVLESGNRPIIEEQANFGPGDRGEGSGVVVDRIGHVLTSKHVVDHATSISVKLPDGQRFTAEVVGMDPATDLAVLRLVVPGLLPITNLRPIDWGDSETLEVGDWVLAMGSPFGLDRSVTAGIVSAKSRQNVIAGGTYQDFLQTDAAVNPGNSGGPLVNDRGEVIGINTAIVGEQFRGVSFAIPSSIARHICERLLAFGHVERGYLGVRLEQITLEDVDRLKLESREGALVLWVDPQAPAADVGLETDDVIVAWNGQPVVSPNDLSLKVAATAIDSTANVLVIRRGEEMTFRLTVARRRS